MASGGAAAYDMGVEDVAPLVVGALVVIGALFNPLRALLRRARAGRPSRHRRPVAERRREREQLLREARAYAEGGAVSGSGEARDEA